MVKSTFLNLPEDKRQKIIDHAIEEFASRPYSKASLSNIVKRAGIAKGSIYQYFDNKRDLYKYLLELAVTQKMNCMNEAEICSEGDFFETLERIMMAGAKFSIGHPELSRLLANAMEPSGESVIKEIMESGLKTGQKYFAELLEKAQKQKRIRSGIDLNLTSYLLIGMISNGLIYYISDSLGLGMNGLMTHPDKVQTVSEEEFTCMIREAISLLRNGLEPKE